jgi:hypothetical protein
MQLQTFPQPVLNCDVTGFIWHQLHQQQSQIIDGAAVINNQLSTVVATINRSPDE